MWIAYLEYHATQNTPITMDEEVLNIDPQEFRMWYTQHNSWAATITLAPSTRTTTTSTASHVPTTSTDLFKHGIKCDPSLFPVLKQDSQFRKWKLHTFYLSKRRTAPRWWTPITSPVRPTNRHYLHRNKSTCILFSATPYILILD